MVHGNGLHIMFLHIWPPARARSYSRYMEDKQGGSTRSERS
jgi:hypothetical protein